MKISSLRMGHLEDVTYNKHFAWQYLYVEPTTVLRTLHIKTIVRYKKQVHYGP